MRSCQKMSFPFFFATFSDVSFVSRFIIAASMDWERYGFAFPPLISFSSFGLANVCKGPLITHQYHADTFADLLLAKMG